jgi:hypothetical protein
MIIEISDAGILAVQFVIAMIAIAVSVCMICSVVVEYFQHKHGLDMVVVIVFIALLILGGWISWMLLIV